jgi:hypothetical protein
MSIMVSPDLNPLPTLKSGEVTEEDENSLFLESFDPDPAEKNNSSEM